MEKYFIPNINTKRNEKKKRLLMKNNTKKTDENKKTLNQIRVYQLYFFSNVNSIIKTKYSVGKKKNS